MYAHALPYRTAIVFSLAALAMPALTRAPAHAQATQPTDEQLIASAMAAAPKPVAEQATIVAMEASGTTRVLRKGSNGFTCVPDNPIAPGHTSMCLDQNAMEWAHAWMTHQTPPDKVGFMYMLAGGTDASNTDPYAKEPASGNHWIATGPHVMVVGPAAAKMIGYPKDADPDTSKPYVMWAGTPYEHLMIPMR